MFKLVFLYVPIFSEIPGNFNQKVEITSYLYSPQAFIYLPGLGYFLDNVPVSKYQFSIKNTTPTKNERITSIDKNILTEIPYWA